jgi:hypothetical protein
MILFWWLSRAFGFFIEIMCNISNGIGIFIIIPLSLREDSAAGTS